MCRACSKKSNKCVFITNLNIFSKSEVEAIMNNVSVKISKKTTASDGELAIATYNNNIY
jgi:hypothetical protein